MDRAAESRNSSEKDSAGLRAVRSFVLRGGRLTEGQKRALEELWPHFGIEESDKRLDLPALFGNPSPVIMEIGFGNGEATWRMASANPQENYLGVEVHRPGVGHLLLKIENHGLENVRIACADAVEFLRVNIAPAALAGVRIYFPDPWHKKRHHKRRIIQPEFLRLLASRMHPQGLLHLATDWQAYADHMLEAAAEVSEFVNLSDCGSYCEKPPWRPETKYQKRGERLGHQVRDLLFQRQP